MTVDDSFLRQRLRTPSSLLEELDRPPQPAVRVVGEEASVPTTAEDDGPLPDAGDAYEAHGRASNKPELMLALLLADGSDEVFAYSDLTRGWLRAVEPGGSPVLTLRFVEKDVSEVDISGQNLRPLLDLVRRHRVPWLRALHGRRNFHAAGKTVITGIHIRPVEA